MTQRFVKFEIGGETFKLAFDMNSICKCEPVCGVNLFQAINMTTETTAAQWRGILWAAMLPAQPKTTLEDAGRIIQRAILTPGKLPELHVALIKTLDESMPEPDQNAENPQQPEQS